MVLPDQSDKTKRQNAKDTISLACQIHERHSIPRTDQGKDEIDIQINLLWQDHRALTGDAKKMAVVIHPSTPCQAL